MKPVKTENTSAMKDDGQWPICKLGEFAEVQNGFAFKSSEFSDSGIPVIKIRNIVPPEVSLDDTQFYNKPINKKLMPYLAKKGDILISMTGSTVNQLSSAVGKIGRYRFDRIALLNQRVGRIYVKDASRADERFLYFFLTQDKIQYQLALNATGSANQANISPYQIKAINISLPPFLVQRRIADILSALDDKIECNRRINQTLEEMARALYRRCFVDFGTFHTGEFVDSELGQIPKGWSVASISDCCDLLSGGTPNTTTPDYWNGEILWATAKDISQCNDAFVMETERKITSLGIEKSATKILPMGTVVIVARGATLGKFAMLGRDMAMNQTCYGLLSRIGASQAWVYLMLDNAIKKLKQASYGTTFTTITTITFQQTKIVLPSLHIFNKCDQMVAPLFDQIHANLKETNILRATRDYLLPKLLSGEIEIKAAEKQLAEHV